MIHIDKDGNVIGSFDPPQGTAWQWTAKGFVYIGNAVHGMNTVRKYDPKTGKLLAEVPRAPETQPGGGGGDAADERQPRSWTGRPRPGRNISAAPRAVARGRRGVAATRAAAARGCRGFHAKYPPTTPMIVGTDRRGSARRTGSRTLLRDTYLGGRVMVFDLDTFAFKRGWGAYGHELSEITTDDKDRAYTPTGRSPRSSGATSR